MATSTGLTGIGGSKHHEAIPDGVAEYSGGVVEPMHGIEKCAAVVLERLPSGMEESFASEPPCRARQWSPHASQFGKT